MAMKDEPEVAKHEGKTTESPGKAASGGHPAERAAPLPPAWIALLYFAGLVVLFAGQRVVVEWETLATTLSTAGALVVVLSVVLRFLPAFAGVREHARVARLLTALQSLGLLGLVLFYVAGDSVLGASTMEADKREVVASVLTVAWMTLISISCCAVAFAEVALLPMRGALHLESRRVFAAAAGGVTLALSISYVSLFVFAASETEAQADFSYFKTSEPGDATVKLMQRLGEPIVVTAFFPEVSEVRSEVKGYLTKLKAKAGNLEIKLVDRYLEPKLAKELQVSSDGSIVLSKGESTETLRVGTELSKARAKLRTLDEDFHAELFKLLRSRRVAYATVGHGELNDKDLGSQRQEGRSSEIFFADLKQQNYRVKDLGLGQGLANAIPEDAGLVMILGPTYPFAPEEIETLRKYVEGGGKVLLALDTDVLPTSELSGAGVATAQPSPAAPGSAAPTTVASNDAAPAPSGSAPAPSAAPEGPAPSSEDAFRVALAEAVGVRFHPTLLADETKYIPRRNNASDHGLIFTNRFSSHASVSTLSRHSSEAGIVLSGAAHLSPIESDDTKSEVTLRSYSSAFADENENFRLDPSEKSETFNLGVALTRPMDPNAPKKPNKDDRKKDDDKDGEEPDDEDKTPEEARVFVIADADVFSDLLMARFRTNRVLAADAVRWLGGEESLAGEFESEEDVHVEQSKQADMTWFYSSIFGVPLLVLGVGLVTNRQLRKGGRR